MHTSWMTWKSVDMPSKWGSLSFVAPIIEEEKVLERDGEEIQRKAKLLKRRTSGRLSCWEKGLNEGCQGPPSPPTSYTCNCFVLARRGISKDGGIREKRYLTTKNAAPHEILFKCPVLFYVLCDKHPFRALRPRTTVLVINLYPCISEALFGQLKKMKFSI